MKYTCKTCGTEFEFEGDKPECSACGSASVELCPEDAGRVAVEAEAKAAEEDRLRREAEERRVKQEEGRETAAKLAACKAMGERVSAAIPYECATFCDECDRHVFDGKTYSADGFKMALKSIDRAILNDPARWGEVMIAVGDEPVCGIGCVKCERGLIFKRSEQVVVLATVSFCFDGPAPFGGAAPDELTRNFKRLTLHDLAELLSAKDAVGLTKAVDGFAFLASSFIVDEQGCIQPTNEEGVRFEVLSRSDGMEYDKCRYSPKSKTLNWGQRVRWTVG